MGFPGDVVVASAHDGSAYTRSRETSVPQHPAALQMASADAKLGPDEACFAPPLRNSIMTAFVIFNASVVDQKRSRSAALNVTKALSS